MAQSTLRKFAVDIWPGPQECTRPAATGPSRLLNVNLVWVSLQNGLSASWAHHVVCMHHAQAKPRRSPGNSL